MKKVLALVLALVNRTLSGPININCDHSDGMGARDTGWIQIYSENHVVERLPYFGYPVNCKTIPEMEAYIDKIATEGGVGHLDFHGVGGDWLDPGLEYFDAMLKKLDSHRDVIWFAPWPEIHKVMCQDK